MDQDASTEDGGGIDVATTNAKPPENVENEAITTKPENEDENNNDDDDDGETKSFLRNAADVPDALLIGWVSRDSRSQPGYRYFFHQDTGACQWEEPVHAARAEPSTKEQQDEANSDRLLMIDTERILSAAASTADGGGGSSSTSAAPTGILKRKSNYTINVVATTAAAASSDGANDGDQAAVASSPAVPSRKRGRSSGARGDEVRVLHLLKKHKGSRRPSSWRKKSITISKEEAIEELRELVSILQEVQDDPKELRATFEELAKTESDCSSSKRGGDLGFFGKKKMQPAFEKASFALKIGQMSDIVETSSGVHVILRLG